MTNQTRGSIIHLLPGIICFLIWMAAPVLAAEISGLDIMKKVDQLEDGDDQSSRAVYTLINRRGQQRVRNTVRFWKDYNGREGFDSKMITFFESPPDVKGTAFLSWSYMDEDRDDDQWLFLPALRKVRRIAAGNKDDYFMGTDFTYDDMGDRKVEEDTHTLLKSEPCGTDECYVVESVPKRKRDMYSKKITWVDSKRWLIQKVDFYDRKGRFLKTLTMVWQEVKGIWTWKRGEMKNHLSQHSTVIDVQEVKVNTGLEDRVFIERTLKRGMTF
ncbi:outer membrane lipoprotein-sorting protein [bacterium]|nr:outer membrane lipoprotein-sorting protein [bacterium]